MSAVEILVMPAENVSIHEEKLYLSNYGYKHLGNQLVKELKIHYRK